MENYSGIQAVIAGHICLDITPGLSHINADNILSIIGPGKLTSVTKPEICTGGTVPNTGLAMKILGCNVALMGKIGNDHFGSLILDILSKYGSSKGMLKDPEASTSYTIILAPQGIDRAFLNYPGANDTFSSKDIDYDLVEKAKLFHFGYPTLLEKIFPNDGEELVNIFKRVKKSDVTTSMDMALCDPTSKAGQANWRTILQNALPYVDIFAPSLDELYFMLHKEKYLEISNKNPGCDLLPIIGVDTLNEMANELFLMGAKIVMIKCGVYGCYLKTSNYEVLKQGGKALSVMADSWSDYECFHPSFKIKTASATGAGDSCIAGFLTSLLHKKNVEQALRIACACGALTASVMDSLTGLKSLDEVEQLINNWPINDFELIYIPKTYYCDSI